nr:transposase [Rufibacter sp. SYSU D00308]
MSAILYRLKTGCQWRELPTREFFGIVPMSWQGVYHHFSKWAGDGSLRKAWTPDAQQKRWGARGLSGPQGRQELQQPVSLRQQGSAAGLLPAGLG